jgi:hypothetical protein
VWVRGVIGLILCLTGIVWMLQGINVVHGSFMSGRGLYTVLGAVAFVLGAIVLAAAWRVRGRLEQ